MKRRTTALVLGLAALALPLLLQAGPGTAAPSTVAAARAVPTDDLGWG